MSHDQKPVVTDAPLAQPQATELPQPQATLSSLPVTETDVRTINADPAPAQPAQTLQSNPIQSEQSTSSHPATALNATEEPPAYLDQATGASKVVPNNVPQLVVPLQMLKGQTSQWIDCPHCKQRTQTKSDTEAETMQFVCGAILCLFCICLTCVPCCAGWFEKTNVSCSRCNKLVAIISSEGVTQVVPTTEQASQASQYAAPAPQQQPMVAKPQQ